MSEYINKQEAIEAFSDMSDGIPINHGDMISDTAVVNVIKSIPSAFEGMTNGEVIKALFPHYDHEDKTEYFGRIRNMDNHFIKADIDFWNAPYQKGGE